MLKIDIKILLLSLILLFSHHHSVALQLSDPPPSFIAIKNGEKGTTLSGAEINTLCYGEATTLDPYDYKLCVPRHAPLAKDIKKLPNFHARFKAHLKRAALTPGSEMDTLLHASITPIKRKSLARLALQKTLKQALLGEIESGTLDAAALGLTEVTAADISILAVASPEIAVPVLAMVLGGRFYRSVKTALKNMLKRSPAGEPTSSPPDDLAVYLNEDVDLKIDSITKTNGTVVRRFKKLVPLHCKFPIVRRKLFLGNYKEDDLKQNATLKRLERHLGKEHFDKVVKNIQPIIDNAQRCKYLSYTDRLPPFLPLTDEELDTTQRKNKLFLVLRTIDLTINSSGASKIDYFKDILLDKETYYRDQTLDANHYLHTQRRNGNARFAYRGPAKVYNGVTASAILNHPRGPLKLTTKTAISFYETPYAQITTENTPQLQNVDVTKLLMKGDIFEDANLAKQENKLLGHQISVHDILDWSTTRRGEQLERSVALVHDSLSFIYAAPLANNKKGPWWVRGPTLPLNHQKEDTAQAIARILDFLNIDTAQPGAMGQIELMMAAAANSLDYSPSHLTQDKIIQTNQEVVHAFGRLSFLRVFNVLKAYQQSLNNNQIEVSIQGNSRGGLITVNYPNKLRTKAIDLNFNFLGFESSVQTNRGPKRIYRSQRLRDTTDHWSDLAAGAFGVPVLFRNIKMKLVSEVFNVERKSAPLRFEVTVDLDKNRERKRLFTIVVHCNNRGDCSLRGDSNQDALVGWFVNQYTTQIAPEDRLLVAITTLKNTSNRDLEQVYPQIIAGFELNYLYEEKTLLSM